MQIYRWTNEFCLRFSILGPNTGHPFRTLGIGQRPFLDAPFTSHLSDLETFRRKAPAITPISSALSSHSPSNGTATADCQGYKPNAPQIQGKPQLGQQESQNLKPFNVSYSLVDDEDWPMI